MVCIAKKKVNSDTLTFEEHKAYVGGLNKEVSKTSKPSIELLTKYYSEAVYTLKDCPKERDFVFGITRFIKEWCGLLWEYENDPYHSMYWEVVLFEAQNRILDSYLLYIEKNREFEDKFYEPRRKCFLKIGLIQAMQDLLDDKLDVLSISMIPGSGKSTLEKFFHSAICGWYPKEYNLFYSHSGDITRMYYDGLYDILTNSDEYTWHEIFPNCRVTSTNAKLEQININGYKPFQNVQCTSVGSKNAGKVRASKFLMCDDLVPGIEVALNKNQLDKLWGIYTVDARQRKIDGCKEIHIATRWSVHDVIGRLQRKYAGDERCRFIAIPDIDPTTGESNFLFDVNGFTVEFFNDQAKLMDDVSYRCLYKNEPVEREGLLYAEEDLRYFETDPKKMFENQEPDAIYAICDTKSKGTDYLFMPIVAQYKNDYYCIDCLCTDSSDYGVQYGRMANLLLEWNVQHCEFESNAGGDRVAVEVEKLVNERGGRTTITTKPTESNKETRIIVSADWVKKHVLFKGKELYTSKTDYGEMMKWLLSYTTAGKNAHDDVPDGFSNLYLLLTRRTRVATAEACINPFASIRDTSARNTYGRSYGYY